MSKKKSEYKDHTEGEGNNIEVWEDVVNPKDLLISILICTITTLGGYLIAPNDPSKELMFGLAGVVAGFLICSLLIKPKRTISYINDEEK